MEEDDILDNSHPVFIDKTEGFTAALMFIAIFFPAEVGEGRV